MESLFSQHIDWAHPLVCDWFVDRFGTPTEAQSMAWPHIAAGKHTLISAPTGSGKTLSAFLYCIDRLVRRGLAGELADSTQVVYVSPLKALSNDIHTNLETPLAEIQALARMRGLPLPPIRSAVRTGDTPQSERRRLTRRPPHILVTTPESLYILITAEKSRQAFTAVETIIVDEIHALAGDKRGSHLSLTLERLGQLCGRPPVRIGLSATQKPLDEIASFLTGQEGGGAVIVDTGQARRLDIAVTVPAMPLGPVTTHEMWDEIYDEVARLAGEHRSTLVFVNTRRLSERLAHRLGERLGGENVLAHHGSLSRKLRLEAERRLKAGQLKVLVATASLELGIDIGAVDLVCQIGSPRSIATALQRIGRSGHWRGATAKGRIFATTRDELIECAALARAVRAGDLDRIIFPAEPLDVLAQQIVASCATGQWSEDSLYAMVRRAYPYRNLSRTVFDTVVSMLAEGFAGRSARFGAYLHRDRVNGLVRARRGARMTAITNGGTIPETGQFQMVAEPDCATVGTLDEDFAIESNRGDIVLLGSTSWRIRRVEPRAGRVVVEDARGAPPTIPFWRGEAPARTEELSRHVAALRERLSCLMPDVSPADYEELFPSLRAAASAGEPPAAAGIRQAIRFLCRECGLGQSAAEQAVEYVIAGRAALGAVPSQDTVIAERFFDESGGMQLIIHAPFGSRINRAWGMALRKRFCRSFDLELQAAATDDGLNISLAERHSFPLADVFAFLSPATVAGVLEQAVLQSPVFNTRFRWDATRALALLRYSGGKKVPPQIQRMRAEDLLAVVFPQAAACQDNIAGEIEIPDHPLVDEVMKDVLSDFMDLDGLRGVLTGIKEGRIRCLAVDTPVPSQFSHEILNANPYAFLDDAPLEERRARAVEMRRVLPDSVLKEVGGLDCGAIARVVEEAWPDVRDADDLHDTLTLLTGLPVDTPSPASLTAGQQWSSHFDALCRSGRAAVADCAGRLYWVAAEKRQAFEAIFPQTSWSGAARDCQESAPDPAAAKVAFVAGWLEHTGPLTAAELSERLGLSRQDSEEALSALEARGSVLRGRFRALDSVEWCERRLLARIHALTVSILRKQIEPVSALEYARWLSHWQHAAPGSQLAGDRGLLAVIKQLQGFEAPANAWEMQIFPQRLRMYSPEMLDRLCLTGQIGWGRLSPHPAFTSPPPAGAEGGDTASGALRRVVPTSVAPITFFLRDDCDWMQPKHRLIDPGQAQALSYAARKTYAHLQCRGACFFAEIVRATGLLKAEVETALWELTTAGLVTADDFDNLRSLIDRRRRSGAGSARSARPRHSTGRWSLLYDEGRADRAATIESAGKVLLGRYGVVFREVLAREDNIPPWRDLLFALRIMEARGEVRGGRFVSGFIGEQFALPLALESLRAMRRESLFDESRPLALSPADPLNLTGTILPGERVPPAAARTCAS